MTPLRSDSSLRNHGMLGLYLLRNMVCLSGQENRKLALLSTSNSLLLSIIIPNTQTTTTTITKPKTKQNKKLLNLRDEIIFQLTECGTKAVPVTLTFFPDCLTHPEKGQRKSRQKSEPRVVRRSG